MIQLPPLPPPASSAGSLATASVRGPEAPRPELLKAAREFEAIFMRTLLAPLEKATQLGKSSSAGQSAYGSMVVGAMADAMTGAGGIGLSEVIVRAMNAQAGISTPGGPKSER